MAQRKQGNTLAGWNEAIQQMHAQSIGEEVDEVTEIGETKKAGQSNSGGTPATVATAQHTQTLDEFLTEMFQEEPPKLEEPPLGVLPSIAFLRSRFKTQSAQIRYMLSRGHSVNEIAKHLDIRYQQVRNVKVTELKRGPNESFKLVPDENGSVAKSVQKPSDF